MVCMKRSSSSSKKNELSLPIEPLGGHRLFLLGTQFEFATFLSKEVYALTYNINFHNEVNHDLHLFQNSKNFVTFSHTTIYKQLGEVILIKFLINSRFLPSTEFKLLSSSENSSSLAIALGGFESQFSGQSATVLSKAANAITFIKLLSECVCQNVAK